VETRLSQRAVSDVMNATIETIQWGLRHRDKVTFPGFGTFYTRHQKEGRVRDIRSGKIITLAARRVAAFRMGAVGKNRKSGNDKADLLILCQNVGFGVWLGVTIRTPNF